MSIYGTPSYVVRYSTYKLLNRDRFLVHPILLLYIISLSSVTTAYNFTSITSTFSFATLQELNVLSQHDTTCLEV